MSVSEWIDEVSDASFIWYVKRLSGNDTLANGSHQAGPYIQRDFILDIFPSMAGIKDDNQERWFDFNVDSPGDKRQVRAVWYNNKFRGKTRNEARLTNFGGQGSPLLDPENTGALTVFAFHLDSGGEVSECRAWVSRHETEEDIIEGRVGAVEPGRWTVWSADTSLFYETTEADRKNPCWLRREEIPYAWLTRFPTGLEIIQKAIEIKSGGELGPDKRLVTRRLCEYELFRSLEENIELPRIKAGFSSIEGFVKNAQTILQRRKSRSGRSLELQAMAIFLEEGMREGVDFSHQPVSELGKKPDFLFPSEGHYRDPGFPDDKIRMLAVKTTCRDRWRQILNEADRVKTKHLLTLQEGISENQFREMQQEGVQLVVPSPVIPSYSSDIRPHLLSLEDFISEAFVSRL
jgi:hypothetical protein